MRDLIIAATAVVDSLPVLIGLAGVVVVLWMLERSSRTRYSAEGRGRRHGQKNKF
jgi:uncharacterized membrane protein YuzA (DUF378 family)